VISEAALSALLNVVILAVIPFLIYYGIQRWRWKRGFAEVTERAGLQLGEARYIGYSVAVALVAVLALVLWPLPLESMTKEGSPQRAFVGLGLTWSAIAMALLYGVIKTGFAEEFLFRGLITGSLARRLSLGWANLIQAAIFLIPHLAVLLIMPDMWRVLPIVFAAALFAGWVRIKSGSIVGPWIMHATANVATCLSVAFRTAL